jgi:hypothetical protein
MVRRLHLRRLRRGANENAMESTRQTVDDRIRHWKRLLALALEDTSASDERRRLEQELLWLEQTRTDLDRLPEDKLELLDRRLAKDPHEWLTHH